MSKRLQVLLDEEEFDELRETARRQGVPVSEWVRAALRSHGQGVAEGSVDSKVQAVRAAVRHEFPTADVDQLLTEIERGYLPRPPA